MGSPRWADADLGRHGRGQSDARLDDRRRHVRALSAVDALGMPPYLTLPPILVGGLPRRHRALLDRGPPHDRPAAADEPAVDLLGQSRADRPRHRRLGHRALQRAGVAARRQLGALHFSRHAYPGRGADGGHRRCALSLSLSHAAGKAIRAVVRQSRRGRAGRHSDDARAGASPSGSASRWPACRAC